MSKDLISEVKIDGFEETAYVFNINNKYYSVVYKEKEEYYTTNIKVAMLVGKIILTFFKNLKTGYEILQRSSFDETGWREFYRFLKEESQKTEIDWDIAHSVYRSLQETYYDLKKMEDKKIVSLRSSIRSKDIISQLIKGTTALFNEKEAEKNLGRYKSIRNEYTKSNPQLCLGELE
ncbi:MAG: hypothetical protein M0Q88_03125 [Bacilli bacterium]|nr:hypothetical protein [Bacilli bacterium]